MPVCIPSLLEGKLLTGVLPPEKQPPIQYFLPQYSQPMIVDIEACIDNPTLAPLGQHVKTKKSSTKKKPHARSGQVHIDTRRNRVVDASGILTLRRKNLSTLQLATELDSLCSKHAQVTDLTPYLKHPTCSLYTDLTELDISRNALTQLPSQISQLTQLTVLNASSNQLTEIPTEIFALKSLQVLTLSQNQIQVIPQHMPSQLPNLVTFRIAANAVHTLPNQLHQWTRMRHFQLGSVFGGNHLTELPESITEMPVLEELDVSYNQLRSIPHDFEIQSLQILNLSHNQLDFLPTSITRCSKLKSLNLSKNHLTSLPADLVNLRRLELLDLSENLLCIMPAEVLERMESATLLITGNPLTRPGHCDLQQSSQDAYGRILRQMMQRGVARSSPVASPSPTHATLLTPRDPLCGPNGAGCLPIASSSTHNPYFPPTHTLTPSTSSSSLSSSTSSLSTNETVHTRPHPFTTTDIDASIDQELSFHAQQLNIDGSRPAIQSNDLIGTSRSKIVHDSTAYSQYVLVDFPRKSPLPTETKLFHSLREIATRTILKLKMEVPFELLPYHLAQDIDGATCRSCSFCQGPFVNEWVTSVQVRSFAGHPAVVRRVRYCSTRCFSRCLPKDHSKSVVCVHQNN